MAKITHISHSREVITKNWPRKVFEAIVDGHQITLRRPTSKTVSVGDEIEYIKNDKGIYVEKTKKDEIKELYTRIEQLEKRVSELEQGNNNSPSN